METNKKSGQALAGLDPKVSTATQQSPLSIAFDESDQDGFFTSSNEVNDTPAKELKRKISLSRLMVRDGHVIKKRGRNQMACCPFHTDNTPSFCIYDDDERARCYGCGWYGDVYNYEMDYRKVDFFKAFQRLEKKLKSIQKTSGSTLAVPKTPREKKLDLLHQTQESQKLKEASQYLANNLWLCEMIAGKRGWLGGTIKALADDGSLGWSQGALSFNYSTGMKLRNWPGRQFLWEFGGPSLWRASLIGSANKVMVCEGETDAITLVDLGLENNHEYAVVALPSATSIPSNITTILQGREVILCLDNDEAGERATDELCDLLQPVCSKLSISNFGEVDHD
jgi:hypothetical protein